MKPRDMLQALKRAGFIEKRQVGSHLSLEHPRSKIIVVVPIHNRDLKRGLMMAIIKDAGLTPEGFLQFL
ncbi:type II toxin-antitoxin system HicA family toxin [Candidatus Peregrinibacteria bacterium]|nr:type II toxin-antitoxin system HicA family toxin [Candidatus Peregrinibacteria bacterium]